MVGDLQYADTVTFNQEFIEIGLIITKIELTEIEDLFYIFGLLGNNF